MSPLCPPRWRVARHLRLVACLTVLALGLAPASAQDTQPMPPPLPKAVPRELTELLKHEGLWQWKADDFATAARGHGFAWTSAEKTCSRSQQRGLVFRDLPVIEALVYFEGGVCKSITINLYNRGDVGDISKTMLDAMVEKTGAKLSDLTGARPRDLDRMGNEGLSKNARLWVQAPLAYRLEWSSTRDKEMREDRPDYLRVQVIATNAQGNVDLLTKGPKAIFSRELRQNLKRLPNGDVYIDNIPMVDQGQKGYCAVAVSERVLRYYGREVDQHDLAMVAGSNSGGTDMNEMVRALRRVADKLGVKVQMYNDFDIHDFMRMYNDYNVAAKRAKKAPLAPLGQMVDVGAVYREMDPGLLADARMHSKTNFEKFVKDCRGTVDAGIPMIWVVQLGLVKEGDLPQVMGGHMRLVIGYNAKTDELLYSDTWGKGHELKRMSAKDAWTITLENFVMKPD